MSRTRQSGIGRSRPRLLPPLPTAGVLASPASPVRAQANPGPKSPALSSCVKKVNAAHPPRSDSKSVPPDRLQALSKGVNLTDVFTPGMSTARVGQDIAQLRSLGPRHARIPLDPSWVISWRPDGKPDARLACLDDTVCSALSLGLAVILDMHPEDSLALKDTAPPDNVDALALAWDRLAARWAASHDVHLVVTEFGVYRAIAPQAARVAWLRDVRKALEARSTGWTVGSIGAASASTASSVVVAALNSRSAVRLGCADPAKPKAGGEGGSMRANLGMATLPTWPGTARAGRRAAGCATSFKGLRALNTSGSARFAVRT